MQLQSRPMDGRCISRCLSLSPPLPVSLRSCVSLRVRLLRVASALFLLLLNCSCAHMTLRESNVLKTSAHLLFTAWHFTTSSSSSCFFSSSSFDYSSLLCPWLFPVLVLGSPPSLFFLFGVAYSLHLPALSSKANPYEDRGKDETR